MIDITIQQRAREGVGGKAKTVSTAAKIICCLMALTALILVGCAAEDEPTDSEASASPVIIKNPDWNLLTSESGGEDNFSLTLASEPSDDVTLTLTSLDTSEGTVNPTTVTFNSSNWSYPQPVTVTGVDDGLEDGNQLFTIEVDPGVSSDPIYRDVAPLAMVVTNADDDSPGISITAKATVLSENGGTGSFNVLLNTQPDGDVVVGVTCADNSEVMISHAESAPAEEAYLTFTPANWFTPQLVTLTGQDDNYADGDQVFDLTVGVDSDTTDTTGYLDLNPSKVRVRVYDDETTGISVTIRRNCE